MAEETVYKYRKYDIRIDDYIYTSRYATMTQINRIEAEPVYSTGIKLDRKHLLPEGWTEKDFDPARIK
jgi:hypothetical protein